jgi:large-conductance mechanosensitive channel
MKKFNRNTSIVLIIFFVLVTSYAAVDLLSLPVEILDAVGVSENSKIQKAQGVAFSSYIVLVVDFFIVLLLIFMFSMNNVNHMAENIVYVEREKQREANDGEDEKSDKVSDEILHKFSSLAASPFNDQKERYNRLLSFLCNEVDASTGALYLTKESEGRRIQEYVAGYAFYLPDSGKLSYEFGEGLVGQSAKSGQDIIINNDVPQGYIKVISGLGEGTPNNLMIIPIKTGDTVNGILEIAGFKTFMQRELDLLKKAGSHFLEEDQISVQSKVDNEVN